MQNGLNKFEIITQKRAELEIDEISEYYESLSKGLGTRFYTDVQKYIGTLENFPFFEEKIILFVNFH